LEGGNEERRLLQQRTKYEKFARERQVDLVKRTEGTKTRISELTKKVKAIL